MVCRMSTAAGLRPRGTLRYCGRDFSPAELETIRRITDDPHQPTRTDIARAVCAALDWYQSDGQPKVMSCRVALQRMEAHGVIWLPLPTREKVAPRRPNFTERSEPRPPISGTLADLGPVSLDLVRDPAEGGLWTELVARHHYRGAIVLPGAQLRYLARAGEDVVAAFGLGAAAWRVAPRDRFIGWTSAEREAHLPQVVDLHRFLVLPWVRVPGLASHLLSRLARRLPGEWLDRYRCRLALMETFVETDRFRGTCYRAANWIPVGQTQGRGRMDRAGLGGQPIKDLWLYPLCPNFRAQLTAGRLSSDNREGLPQPTAAADHPRTAVVSGPGGDAHA